MKDNNKLKKVVRKGETYERNQNQHLKRVKKPASWDKEVQAEREDFGDIHFERSRIKIEVESSEDMGIN